MPKRLLLTFVLLVFTFAVAAQDTQLRDDHPDRYVVQKGDTLWDISARFLKSPWLWPEVWYANPQIENPHLIYPGDVISLTYVDGKPRLAVERGRETVKLSPRIRTEPHREAIDTIPLDAVRPFLQEMRIVNPGDRDKLAYVVAQPNERLIAGEGDEIYVRRLDAKPGDAVIIGREGQVFRQIDSDPPRTEAERWELGGGNTISRNVHEAGSNIWNAVAFWKDDSEVLGYEVIYEAEGQVVAAGDPATVHVTGSRREITPGDVVLPGINQTYNSHFEPRPAPADVHARVIALAEGFYGAGQYQVVALDKGSADGLQPGHTFAVHEPGRRVRDNVMHPAGDLDTTFQPGKAKVDLPDREIGHLMVFRTFDHISYALVMEAQDVVRPNYYAVAP